MRVTRLGLGRDTWRGLKALNYAKLVINKARDGATVEVTIRPVAYDSGAVGLGYREADFPSHGRLAIGVCYKPQSGSTPTKS